MTFLHLSAGTMLAEHRQVPTGPGSFFPSQMELFPSHAKMLPGHKYKVRAGGLYLQTTCQAHVYGLDLRVIQFWLVVERHVAFCYLPTTHRQSWGLVGNSPLLPPYDTNRFIVFIGSLSRILKSIRNFQHSS